MKVRANYVREKDIVVQSVGYLRLRRRSFCPVLVWCPGRLCCLSHLLFRQQFCFSQLSVGETKGFVTGLGENLFSADYSSYTTCWGKGKSNKPIWVRLRYRKATEYFSVIFDQRQKSKTGTVAGKVSSCSTVHRRYSSVDHNVLFSKAHCKRVHYHPKHWKREEKQPLNWQQ